MTGKQTCLIGSQDWVKYHRFRQACKGATTAHKRHFGVGFESTAGVAWPVLPKLSSRWWT